MFKRVHLIVMDSVGIGEAPDAAQFNDVGSDTLGHIAETAGLTIPHLEQLGLGTIRPLAGVEAIADHQGYATKLEEVSVGKDTMTGHWEIMGLNIQKPFRVFPEGFPPELLQQIEAFSGRKVVCNLPYSGTEVLDDYGPGQMETGDLIIYTSADPVLQIAAHEEVIPLEELYRICEYVREITKDEPYMIGRIIARPYLGEPGNFKRTSNRHDYTISPTGTTAMDILKENKYTVSCVGKINDIFNGCGVTETVHTISNQDGMDKTIALVNKPEFKEGLCFVNLVEFDSEFGHRRNVLGYGNALQEFDVRLKEMIKVLKDDDLLMVTADHGNDPTYKGTDHTREKVPLLVYSKSINKGEYLGDRDSFADIGASILDNFNLKSVPTMIGRPIVELFK